MAQSAQPPDRFYACSTKQHAWSQCGANLSWKRDRPAQVCFHLPLPYDKKGLGAAVPRLVSVGSSSLQKWIQCWVPIRPPWLAVRLHLSTTSASFLSTWSCCHLNQPHERAALQHARVCWREAVMVPQRSQTERVGPGGGEWIIALLNTPSHIF